MWYLWIGSNLAAVPVLFFTGWLLVGRWLVAVDKYTTARSRASRMLAVRNIVVSLVFLGTTLILLGTCGWLLVVSLRADPAAVRVYEAWGTLLVVLAICGLMVGVYFDLKYTGHAAEVAEQEARG